MKELMYLYNRKITKGLTVKSGTKYKVSRVKTCKCGNVFLDIGIPIPEGSKHSQCSKCKKEWRSKSVWLDADDFGEVIKKPKKDSDIVIRFDGRYLPNGKPAIEGINTHESKWCCSSMKNSDNDIGFSRKDRRFWRSGGQIDLGMGGFGNRTIRGDDLDECPYCHKDLTKIGIMIVGHNSIDSRHKYLCSLQ